MGCESRQNDVVINNTSQEVDKSTVSVAPVSEPKLSEATVNTENQGTSLTKVAGQHVLPYVDPDEAAELPSTWGSIVGRYHVHIPCSDDFALCSKNEGYAEYIVNLLPDRTAYWTIANFGQIGLDPNNEKLKNMDACRKLRWSADIDHREVVIRCDRVGTEFYYRIDQQSNLVMNLKKTWAGNNGHTRRYFQEKFYTPDEEYVLIKDK